MLNIERAKLALEKKMPDRVPIFELMIDPKVIKAICPLCSYADFVEKYDFDIVLTGTPSSNYRNKIIKKEPLTYRDEWGVIRRYTGEIVAFPMEGPIKSEKDIESYTPPDPEDDFRFKSLNELVKRFKGKKLIGMHVHDAFSYPTYLRGMDNFLMDLIADPEFAKRLIKIAVEHTKSLMRKAVKLGAELFVFGDDYGSTDGPLMSPNHFKEFFLPGLTEVVQLAKNLGAYAIKHTDGNINKIIEMIVGSGIDGIHPLDPEAGMDITEIKQKFKGRVCLLGNIDTGKILSNSSPEVVEETVKNTILDVAPGGGYIIASANSIHSHVKPQNYMSMLKAARKYGNYKHLGQA